MSKPQRQGQNEARGTGPEQDWGTGPDHNTGARVKAAGPDRDTGHDGLRGHVYIGAGSEQAREVQGQGQTTTQGAGPKQQGQTRT